MSASRPDLPSLLAQIVSLTTDSDVVRIIQECSDSEVHPVFARDRWTDITDCQFLALGPALVLASNILACDRSLHFWHALFYGAREDFADRHGMRQSRFLPVNDTSVPLPSQEKDRVTQTLQEMSPAVRFRLEEMTTSHGMCYSGEPLHEFPYFANCHRRSVQSTIAISRPDIEALILALRFGSADSPLGRWFKIACTLVHEVSHAASNFVNGAGQEGFFGPQTFSEMGHAIIKWLFDCQFFITYRESTKEEVVAIHQLPSLSYVKGYRKKGLFPLLTTLKAESETIGIVDRAWIRAQFPRSTWEHDVPASSCALLAPPAIFCTCKRCGAATGVPTIFSPAAANEAATHVTVPPFFLMPAGCQCVSHQFTFADEVGGGEDEEIQWMLSLTWDQVSAVATQDQDLYWKVLEARRKYTRINWRRSECRCTEPDDHWSSTALAGKELEP